MCTLHADKRVCTLCVRCHTHAQAELIARLVDRYEYGCLPKCAACGVGRLEPDGHGFKCPGGVREVNGPFEACGARFGPYELERPTFQLPKGFVDAGGVKLEQPAGS